MRLKWVVVAISIWTLPALTSCMEPAEGLLTVGEVAPSVRTKNLQDVGGDMSRLTTYRHPDERMYQYSLDEAMGLGKPIVLEFATPGHCTVCDKQLQMLKGMISKYGKQVVFLHMDQYKNPEAFSSYHVKGDPWTFIIDGKNIVQFKRAGRILYGELDYQIKTLLQQEKNNKIAKNDSGDL